MISRLFRTGNAEKHNPQKDAYDRHNHNHKKIIEDFLMIMTLIVMSLVRTEPKWIVVRVRVFSKKDRVRARSDFGGKMR